MDKLIHEGPRQSSLSHQPTAALPERQQHEERRGTGDPAAAGASRALLPAISHFIRNFFKDPIKFFQPPLAPSPVSLLKERAKTGPAPSLVSLALSYKQLAATIRQNGGVKSVARWIAPPFIANALNGAVVFSVYDSVHLQFGAEGRSVSGLGHYMAGAIAGGVVSFISCPVENVRERSCWLQTQYAAKHSTLLSSPSDWISAFADVFRRGGIIGLFRSLPSVLVRETVGYSVFFGSYSTTKHFLKSKYLKPRPNTSLSSSLTSSSHRKSAGHHGGRIEALKHPLIILVSGAIAGAGYTASEQLIQRVTFAFGAHAPDSGFQWLAAPSPSSPQQIAQKQSLLSFIRPISLIRSVPPASIAFLLYEAALKDKM